jgi:hypothetical protein
VACHAHDFGGGEQRRVKRLRVDRPLAGRQGRGPHPRCQARLEGAGLPPAQGLDREPQAALAGHHLVEGQAVVGVDGGDERAVRPVADLGAGRALDLGGEARPPGPRGHPQGEEGLVAHAGLGDRRQHPGGDRGGAAPRRRVDDRDGHAPLGEAPG